MTTLRIQPVEYNGNGLDVLGKAIVRRFYPLLQDFRLNNNLTLDSLSKSQHRGFRNRNFTLKDTIALDSNKFLNYLRKFGNYTLGITSMPVRDWWFDVFWSPLILKFQPEKHTIIEGQAGNEYDRVAFVSTYALADDLERKISVATEEIGHVFGLVHHNEFIRINEKRTSDGALCVMSFDNEKGNRLCRTCYKRLDIPEPTY